ncbi:hypothetical protein [Bradyrhizobium sp. AZCC 2289]|uniref:hypothetical protein n=1 Tax=Bradyrhizobium sp. AZCC 2289 TaxID=3117026 RepID=UPI002FEF52FF
MSSRIFKSVLLALAACALLNGPASAGYPDRLIKIVVPFAPGGGTDVVARTLAQEMARDLGVSVIIENKPGQAPSSVPSPSRPARLTATRC